MYSSKTFFQDRHFSQTVFQCIKIYCFTAWHHASAAYAVVVCVSVTSQCSTEIANRRIMQTMPQNSSGTLVYWCQWSLQNSNGVTSSVRAKCGWIRL